MADEETADEIRRRFGLESDVSDEQLSEVVWRRLEAIPGFNERLRKAKAELAAGKGIRFEHHEPDEHSPEVHFWNDERGLLE